MRSARIRVRGKVQGVWFRQSALNKAQELGVRGYVTNLEDGSVELLAQGSEAQVTKLLDWCWQGPPMADVSAVEEENDEADTIYLDFSILSP